MCRLWEKFHTSYLHVLCTIYLHVYVHGENTRDLFINSTRELERVHRIASYKLLRFHNYHYKFFLEYMYNIDKSFGIQITAKSRF